MSSLETLAARLFSLEFSVFRSPPASPGLNLLIGSLHGAKTWWLSSFPAGIHWDARILSGFGLLIDSAPFSNLNGLVFSGALSSHSLSYFWTPLPAQDGWLCSPESLWSMANFLQLTQAPFYQNLHVTVFTSVSSVGGWNLGILCLWGSWAAWPPPTNLTPLTLLVPLSPSGGSSVINPSLVQTPRPDQTPLFPPAWPPLPFSLQTSSSLGVVGRKNWFRLKILIIPHLFVLCLDISVFEFPKPRIWVFCSLLQNINPALRQWILKVFE